MPTIERSLLLRLLTLVLRPAVLFCVRHSIKLQDLIECAKVAFVEAADKEFSQSGLKSNVSRISVMTGVHRRDVMRFQTSGLDPGTERDLVTKIIGHWRSDKRFMTKSGDPRVLSVNGADSDFNKLCESISLDINPGTVLFELQRIQAVIPAKGGIKLIHESYVPKGDAAAGFAILADDYETLLNTVDENVLGDQDLPHFHARTSYDNVSPAAVSEIRRWFLREGHEFHKRVRAFLSRFDRDVNPDLSFEGKGVKVVFGSFTHVPRADEKREDDL